MKRVIVGAVLLGAALVATPGSAQAQAEAAAKMAEGAQVYGKQCVRCHNARSPMERTDREWLTIVNHMRARANLTRPEAEALIFFLQATNGPEARALLRTDQSEEDQDQPSDDGEDPKSGEGGGGSVG